MAPLTVKFGFFAIFLTLQECRANTNGTDFVKSTPRKDLKCTIKARDDKFARFLDDDSIVLSEFNFRLFNYSENPLVTDISENYKPWRWHRALTQHGRTLLMLSFHYDVLSMSILTIGVKIFDAELMDTPFGCFGNLTSEKRVFLIRNLILDNFNFNKKTSSEIEPESYKHRTVYVCNEIVQNDNGFAKFLNRCCNQNSDGSVTCTNQLPDGWIYLLYVCITLVKVMVFFFSPFMIPTQFYSASYAASEYAVKLSKNLKLKLYVTENKETSVRYKKRLTIEDVADWKRFRENLEAVPIDQIVPISIPELRIKVKRKRIIPDNDPPTGIFRTIYDNLIRCKIKRLDPFAECCDLSVYASLEPQFEHKCTWHMCVQGLVKVLLFLFIPTPYYIRLLIYYFFEREEILFRKHIMESLDLKEAFDLFRANVIQFFSPTHGVFIATYIFYFLSGFILCISGKIVREKLKCIARDSLQDMANVRKTSVLQVLLQISLWPYRRCGLLALLLAPIYSFFTAPVCTMIFIVYCIPTIYLSHRLLYHSRKKINYDDDTMESSKSLSKKKEKLLKMRKKISEIDKNVHSQFSRLEENSEGYFPWTWGPGKFNAIRRFIVQTLVGLFCLSVLYAMVLLIVEAVGLVVEVLAFTMMGIIINAGSTLRYVSMALLVIIYMHDCYNNVYESYLTFDRSVHENIMDRVEDLKMVASLPSNMQENAAFQVKPVEAVDTIPTTLIFSKKEPSWEIGHLLLFLDSFDTPRIPLRLFQQVCEIRVHGAPGPVYINLLRATGKFLIIVVFLFFVMIVVMAFGNVHQVSSTNQTLATLAGGFVPMLLKNVLPRKSVNLNLKTLSFKGQIDEIICDFKQNWPICDFVFEREVEDDKEHKTDESDDTKKERRNSIGDLLNDSKKDDHDGENPKNPEENKEKSVDTLEKYMKEGIEKKLYTEKRHKEQMLKDQNGGLKDQLGNGDFNGTDQLGVGRENSLTNDDNFVDLFIDLSVADTSLPWQIYGSSETLPSISMLPPDDKEGKNSTQQPFPDIKVESC